MSDSSCISRSAKDNGTLCPYFYAQVSIGTGSIRDLPAVDVMRSDVSSAGALVRKKDQPHEARNFYKVFLPLNQAKYYHIVDFKQTFSNELKSLNSINVKLDFGLAGDTARISFSNLKANARISKTGWTQASSLSALETSDGNSWYSAGGMLHIKFKTGSESRAFGGSSSVDVLF
jgi:hypothetical protein